MADLREDSSEGEIDPLDKVVRIGQLMDVYGGLLTEKQQLFVRLHYEEDLSFGEIARQHGVSRQAIHDAAKHAEESLEKYEAQLGLLAKGYTKAGTASKAADGDDEADGATVAASGIDGDAVRGAAGKLRGIAERIRKSGGVIYSGEGIARELAEMAAELEKAAEAKDEG